MENTIICDKELNIENVYSAYMQTLKDEYNIMQTRKSVFLTDDINLDRCLIDVFQQKKRKKLRILKMET